MVSNKSFILGRENQIRKLLITLGCSLTYGEGTENPSKQGWPPLLCEKLGYKLIYKNYKAGLNNCLVKIKS